VTVSAQAATPGTAVLPALLTVCGVW
jgi:hypothetical protein